MWVYRGEIVDFGEDIDNIHDKVLELMQIEKMPLMPLWKDDPEPENSKLTNCKNCGAPLTGTKCEYCGTEYAPKIENPYCEEADAERANFDGLVVTQENLQNSLSVLSNTADDAKRALMDFSEEIKMIEAEEGILWFFVCSVAAAALIVIIAFVLNLFA